MKTLTPTSVLLSAAVLIASATLTSWTSSVGAEEIGKVDTRFRFLTPDDTIRIEVFDDPDVVGVAC
ncbi:MAG: CreA family protein, partial [Woeseia sp.]